MEKWKNETLFHQNTAMYGHINCYTQQTACVTVYYAILENQCRRVCKYIVVVTVYTNTERKKKLNVFTKVESGPSVMTLLLASRAWTSSGVLKGKLASA